MKIQISQTELNRLVSEKYNIPAGVAVEVIPDDTSSKAQLVAAIVAVTALDFRATEKIAAIKLLREYTRYGLSDAKWAIENWDTWRKAAEQLGSFPIFSVHLPQAYTSPSPLR